MITAYLHYGGYLVSHQQDFNDSYNMVQHAQIMKNDYHLKTESKIFLGKTGSIFSSIEFEKPKPYFIYYA